MLVRVCGMRPAYKPSISQCYFDQQYQSSVTVFSGLKAMDCGHEKVKDFKVRLFTIPWRIKPSEELDELIQRKNIIRFIKSQRLKWLGRIERMQKEREVTKLYKWKPFVSRPIGRPKNRWEDDVRKDLQAMKIKNWMRSVLDRDLWKKIVERTKTHAEL